MARACSDARLAGADEGPLVAQAWQLAASKPALGAPTGSVAYFVGACLLDRRDRRARSYLLEALREKPMSARVRAALARSLLIS